MESSKCMLIVNTYYVAYNKNSMLGFRDQADFCKQMDGAFEEFSQLRYVELSMIECCLRTVWSYTARNFV